MQKRQRRLVLLVVLMSLCDSGWSQDSSGVVVEHDVVMKTRDGVALKADIYRPVGDKEFPVLLERTPYNKVSSADFGWKGALRGFVVVIQDVRGRFASDGEWYPFKYEANDGYDAVEWAATLPHANGKVGMFGGSYVGATQMLAAIKSPPHLAGICPKVTSSNYYENFAYQGGAFEQWFSETWSTLLAQESVDRMIRLAMAAKSEKSALIGSSTLQLNQYRLFDSKISPASENMTRELAPFFLDWLDHPLYDSFWKQWAIDEQYASIQVPALTMAAWYDIFQDGSLRNFQGMKAYAGTDLARKQQKLLIIIGGHAGGARKVGSVDFGQAAEHIDPDAITLAWYDYLLRGIQNEYASDKPVKIFVMGENKWRLEDSWPLERAEETRYFLHSRGNANSSSGDGVLSKVAAKAETADAFIYDPENPVPTVGGPLCCSVTGIPPGPQDQAKVEERSDVLVYSTPQFDRDMEVTGHVTLDFYAKSSAADTDFTAKLLDVWPNGFVQNLTEGIIRARYRNSMEKSEMLVPGRIYRYTVDMWSTSNVFLKGHKVRLEISSSNFPRFDRNLNTGKDASNDRIAVKATNTIFHDADHPSALVLPIVPR